MPRITVKFELDDVVASADRCWVLGEVECIEIRHDDHRYKIGGRDEWYDGSELKLVNRRAERHDE